MCGIAGILSSDMRRSMEQAVRSMTDVLQHRGPDDSGVWCDHAASVGLGHRRLAVLDRSCLGRQPMASSCGRYIMVHNGEVYNHEEIRSELTRCGHGFSGRSDTETMLAAVERFGLDDAVQRFDGMFAFALWDRRERALTLVRDRLGIKPLYYGHVGSDFVFGSELKALREHPDWNADIDRDALCLYFRHNYIPAPYTVYSGIRKLEPGHMLTVRRDGVVSDRQYWSAAAVWVQGLAEPFSGSENEAEEQLDALLGHAVKRHMIADVPLGAFLSGGIDSSAVAAFMQARSMAKVKTFSIGFPDQAYDEAPAAARVAAHLGTEHTQLYVTPQELMETIPLIPVYWDEPFADSSQVPTFCLSRLTRQHVTVSLSGDGGDELFHGYTRYYYARQCWNSLNRIPIPVRSMLLFLARLLPHHLVGKLGRRASAIHWRIDFLKTASFSDLYRYLVSHHKQPETFVRGGREPETCFGSLHGLTEDEQDRLMSLLDVMTYLPDDILTKVDRAGMAVGLETRIPLLDHRVVAFAASLPMCLKVRNGKGKWLLRKVLSRYVPERLFDRPKMGFGVPIEHWLRNELREWCESLLDPRRIREQGYIDDRFVTRMWTEYLSGQNNWHYYLWDVLMFQAWLEENR